MGNSMMHGGVNDHRGGRRVSATVCGSAAARVATPHRLRAVARILRAAAPHVWFLEAEVAALREFVPSGAVCLDVGAEYRLYTWPLADLAGPAGHVHAIEPQPGPAHFVRAWSGTRLAPPRARFCTPQRAVRPAP